MSIDAPYWLAATLLIFVWYRIDADRRSFERTPSLNTAMVAASAFGLTYYLFRSRGFVHGAVAIGGCLALFVATLAIVATGQYFFFGEDLPTKIQIAQIQKPTNGFAGYRKFSPPHYPLEMVRNHVQGKVMLKVLIGTTDQAESVSVATSSGHQQLDDDAVKATWKSEFYPAERDGRPVSSFALVPVDFKLEEM